MDVTNFWYRECSAMMDVNERQTNLKLELILLDFEFHSFVASWSVNVQRHVSSTLILLLQMLLSTMSWTFFGVATSEGQCTYRFRVNVDFS